MALSGGGKAYIGLIFLLIASLLMLAAHEYRDRRCVVRADQIDRWTEDDSNRRLVAFGSQGVPSFSYCNIWYGREDADLRDVECWQDRELGWVLAASADVDQKGDDIFFDFLHASLDSWADSQGCRIGHNT